MIRKFHYVIVIERETYIARNFTVPYNGRRPAYDAFETLPERVFFSRERFVLGIEL